MRVSFFSLILFGLITCIQAQTYYFENYSVKDGLSQSKVYRIAQDEGGYVWIGTLTGISRFDGIAFKNYGVSEGTAANGVRSLFKDTTGVIWFGHIDGGITLLEDGNFKEFKLSEYELTTTVSSIAKDDEGRIWISTDGNGVFRLNNPYDMADGFQDVNQFVGKDGLSDRVFEIVQFSDGHMYFVTDVGVKRTTDQEGIFESYTPEKLSTYFQISALFEDSKGFRWYGTYNGGLYRQNIETGEFRIFDVRDGLASNWISRINEDHHGRVWAATFENGISVIEGDEILSFGPDNGLPDKKIYDVIPDREGNMLIGSFEYGMFVFKGEHFVSYSTNDGLSSDQVWTIAIDKYGKAWAGTNAGIDIIEFDGKERRFTYITEEDDNFISDDIRFIKEDNDRNLWVGTYDGGVIKVDPAKPEGPYVYSGRMNGAIRFGQVTSMDVDKFNNLWVGTLDGLIYYEINTGAMSYLTSSSGLAGNDISEIYCDSDGNTWVGCRGKGLTKISGEDFLQVDLGAAITPTVIKEDKEGNIWIGTEGQGLFISKDGKSITGKFTTEDGLLANMINLLEADEENNIWVGTNKGLNKLIRESNTFISYTKQDGFTGIETKPRSTFTDENGRIWFGTVKGLIRYSPKKDHTEANLPLVKISKLRVNLEDREIESKNYGDSKSPNFAEFTYKEKNFYFDFKGIYLTNPKSVKYKYLLEGIDQDWSTPTNLTFANYPALPDGKYTFKVMASNNTGRWSEEPAVYHFVITPPFWKTWWFYLFCVVFVGSWIAYLIKVREENLIREKKILEDKVAERTAEIQEKNKELASKNKDITDSIRYAERIQRAILPPNAEIKKLFPDSFVFYRPKDIVSGDFYWVSGRNGHALFSAIDCTGHGVPGAFMSIVGHNLLDKIVKEEDKTIPNEILDSLNNSVSETLRQKSETNDVKDGMDLGLVCLDKEKNKMYYSGAHNPMYIIRNGELIETKADKFAIGSFIRGEKRKFTLHEFDMMKGDVVYVFSDGFPDQFGGELGKKYKYKPFKQFLTDIHNKPVEEQQSLLEDEFLRWKGHHEQIDDVIVFGVRI